MLLRYWRACDCTDDVQYAIEQLQQQLQDSEQVQDDIKAEARQVLLQPPSFCLVHLTLEGRTVYLTKDLIP